MVVLETVLVVVLHLLKQETEFLIFGGMLLPIVLIIYQQVMQHQQVIFLQKNEEYVLFDALDTRIRTIKKNM